MRSWNTCMRIQCKESWCNIPRTGLGAVGRTTREREKVEFGSTQTKRKMWKQQLRGRNKTRTLKTEGCGTPKVKTNCTDLAPLLSLCATRRAVRLHFGFGNSGRPHHPKSLFPQ